MSATFVPAPEVEAIAREIIAHQVEHDHLRGARILYLFRRGTWTSKGKVVFGRAKKLTGELLYVARQLLIHQIGAGRAVEGADYADENGDLQYDFALEINRDYWPKLTDLQRRAIVDHELCFPAGTVVTGPSVHGASVRWYAGELVAIKTAAGDLLTGTPNHPVLTSRGWLPLQFVREGDYVFRCRDAQRVAATVDPHQHQVETSIEQIARALNMVPGFVPQTAQYLHSERAGDEIDVVPTDRELLDCLNAALGEQAPHGALGGGNAGRMELPRDGELVQRRVGVAVSPPSGVGLARVDQQFFGGQSTHAVALGGAAIADGDAAFSELLSDRHRVRAARLRERIRGLAGEVALSEVVRTERQHFEGHVYNLQTAGHWYIANSIITHNCHCIRQDKGWAITGHDVEGFGSNIRRYGLYMEDLAAFGKAVRQAPGQMTLDDLQFKQEFPNELAAQLIADELTVPAGVEGVTVDMHGQTAEVTR